MLPYSRLEVTLRELSKIEVQEEQMNRILGFLQKDFSALSSGIFLYQDHKFQLKIGRNISHTYTKNTIFTDDNSFIQDLKENRFLSLKNTDSCRFEHECRHILVHLLQVRKDVYGFIFADKAAEFFTEDEESLFVMLAEFTSLLMATNRLTSALAEKREFEEAIFIYRYKTFMEKGSYLFHLLRRSTIKMSVAVMKLNKYAELVRKFGHQQTSEYLQDVLNLTQEQINPIDIPGKIFDDTYAIIFPNQNPKQVEKTIGKILQSLKDKIDSKEKRVSWGITGMNKNSTSFEQLVSDSEEAAFEATRQEDNPVMLYE